MGCVFIKNLDGAHYNRKLYYADTVADLPELKDPHLIYYGSKCEVISTGRTYVVNSDYEWQIMVEYDAGGGGGGGIADAPYDDAPYIRQNGAWVELPLPEVENSLTSTDPTRPLAAAQGKILNDKHMLVAGYVGNLQLDVADLDTRTEELEADMTLAKDNITDLQSDVQEMEDNFVANVADALLDPSIPAYGVDISYDAISRTLTMEKNDSTEESLILPQATNARDGLMTAADRRTLVELHSDVESLKNGGVWRAEFATLADLLAIYPNRDVSNTDWFVNDYVEVIADETASNGIHTQFNPTIYRVEVGSNNTMKTLVYQKDVVASAVQTATNAFTGVVKGDELNTHGKIFIESDGSMSLIGYDDHTQAIANNTQGIAGVTQLIGAVNTNVQAATEDIEDLDGRVVALENAENPVAEVAVASTTVSGTVKLSTEDWELGGDPDGHLMLNGVQGYIADIDERLLGSSGRIGEIFYWPGIAPPDDALFCDGSAVSRIVYKKLFAVIGTTFGTGNGSTTFNLPDMRGEFVRGYDPTAIRDPAGATRAFGRHQNATRQGVVTNNNPNNVQWSNGGPQSGAVEPDLATPVYSGAYSSANGSGSLQMIYRDFTARPTNINLLPCIRFRSVVINEVFLPAPLYSQIETTNRISTNNGTWTVEKNGYIQVRMSGLGILPVFTVFVNETIAYYHKRHASSALNQEIYTLIPVSAGDEVRLNATDTTTPTFACYFIPIIETDYKYAQPIYTSGEAKGASFEVIEDGFVQFAIAGPASADGYANGLINNVLVASVNFNSGFNGIIGGIYPVKTGDTCSYGGSLGGNVIFYAQELTSLVNPMENSPNLWPANVEVNLRDGRFGYRTNGTLPAIAANITNTTTLWTTGFTGDFNIINSGGWIEIENSRIPINSVSGSFHSTLGIYNTTKDLYLLSFYANARPATDYSIWIIYSK